jgi:hypothetical protein
MRHKRTHASMLVLLVLLGLLALDGRAFAAAPDFLLQMPEGQTHRGSGAGELDNPRGVAGDPGTGHVYISEYSNARISEYSAWGLFVKSWGWGVSDGSSALQTCGPAEPEAAPPPTLCRKGSEGGGKGQLDEPIGVAVDPSGSIYVFESGNARVQKFSPTGDFLVMFGGKVNKTKVDEGAPVGQQNVCPLVSADVCQAGTAGEGPGQFGSGTIGDYIDYSPSPPSIVVGDRDRIQIFNLDGTFKEEIPFGGGLSAFAGLSVNGLDIDTTGRIYLSFGGRDDVYKLSSSGAPLDPGKPEASKFKVEDPQAVAVEDGGGVYAVEGPVPARRVLKFDMAGNRLVPTKAEEEKNSRFPYVPFQGPELPALATNICAGSDAPGNLYVAFFDFVADVSHVNTYGTPPAGCEPPPPGLPEVQAQYATSVGLEEATLKAQINPRFFRDTLYYVEYGTEECSKGGCDKKSALPPGSELTDKSINAPVTSAGVALTGLEPGTTYHYRFVVESGFELAETNGPVFGEDPDGNAGPQEASFEAGVERTFRTFSSPAGPPRCSANEEFRIGASAELPDCRAYEMVSPLEKENGDVALWIGQGGLIPRLFELHQSAPSGERFAYSSSVAFDEPQGSPFISQYLAQRTAAGWSSDSLSPPRTLSPVGVEELLGGEFHGFSSDLCTAWLRHYSVKPLAKDGIAGFANIYRRENCAAPAGYETITTLEPTNREADKYRELRALGGSEDGRHSIFTANASFLDAPPLGPGDWLLYEHAPDGLRFVCYLPEEGGPSPGSCSAGMPAGTGGGNESSVRNAISSDGRRIFWTAYTGIPKIGVEAGAAGQIYVRIDGSKTLPVSGSAPGAEATDLAKYWTAANDGSKALFEFSSGGLKDELYEFDVQSATAKRIAKGVEGPMGASEDASRVYFASKEDLDEGGPASVGAHNLYLYEADAGGGGTFTFIMALAGKDMLGTDTEPTPIDEVPAQRSASVSPDGLHVAFTSAASPSPTGYDNRDAVSGNPTQEVYLYDAEEHELICVSCNPTEARPTGEQGVAARIQGWETLLHAPRVLSNDGRRVFFESREELVPLDTNGAWDVYQWEELGTGSCSEEAEGFDEAAAGCIDLISSGESARDSTFLDADASGENVFIGTLSSLVPQDYGLNDVYDVRVGGGFPTPVERPSCEGEACQSPPAPPADVTPASEAFRGPGNPRAGKPRRRCKSGMRRVRRNGKSRCVKKAKPDRHRRAGR